MKNWIIRKKVKLRAWIKGFKYRRDHRKFRKGFAWVMCRRHIDAETVGTLQREVDAAIEAWNESHPHGPVCHFLEGAAVALRRLREQHHVYQQYNRMSATYEPEGQRDAA